MVGIIGKTKAGEDKKIKPFKAYFSNDEITSNEKAAFDLYSKSRIGEIVEEKVRYSLCESLFLVEAGKINIYFRGKKLRLKKFKEKLEEIDKKLGLKYSIYKDMKSRGYIVKTALKFGAEFRVYDKGKKPGEEHARWILYPVSETSSLTWHDFAAKNRVAHSTKKNLLIGIVDEEGDVSYYECKWLRP